jgi:ferritin
MRLAGTGAIQGPKVDRNEARLVGASDLDYHVWPFPAGSGGDSIGVHPDRAERGGPRMMNKKLQDALNAQLNAESYSAHLYMSMSAYFQSVNLKGMAHWMRLQAAEETAHELKFFDYILSRGGKVALGQIGAPPTDWESPLAVFEAAYEHETQVSAKINKLVDLALAESDHASNAFLQWFVTEQVEEEESVLEIVDQLKLIADDRGALFMLDRGKTGTARRGRC